MADKTKADRLSEMREHLRGVAQLEAGPEKLEDQIRRVVREELGKLGIGRGEWVYNDYDYYQCSICGSQLETHENDPILHRSVVDCFKAFLRRMRV